MKKIFLILMLLQSSLVFSQDVFTADFEIEASYYLSASNNNQVMIEDKTSFYLIEKHPALETMFKGRVYAYDLFFIGGSTSALVDNESDKYMPLFNWYQFETGIKYCGVEFFYEHFCAHTSVPFGYRYRLMTGIDKAYDKIGVRFKGSVK